MVLNKGLDFMEVSETSVEMQLNENKKANANEFAKLFHISPETASGKAQDLEGLAKLAAIPVMKAIECALNQALLRESEKGSLYWAFDTKELLKGSLRERMEAYKLAVDANIMQIDEIRFEEDLPALGLNWIKLGLEDVLYDPKTNTVYTPNTNQTAVMGKLQLGGAEDLPLQERADDGIIENRGGRYIQGPDGKMQGSLPEGGSSAGGGDPKGSLLDQKNLDAYLEPQKTKYAKSQQRSKKGIRIEPKKYARLCCIMGTHYPNTAEGQKLTFHDNKHRYHVTADGDGGFTVNKVVKLRSRRKK